MFDLLARPRTIDGTFVSASLRAGQGFVELSHVAGRTVPTRMAARSPLKILAPRRKNAAAWIYTSTFGGGLVRGNRIDLTLLVRRNARAVITSQASTKVYRTNSAAGCRQDFHATVEDGGLLIVAPDPVTCFAGAVYEQSQSVALNGSGSLLLVDWYTSGRRARGEHWAMASYRSSLRVSIDGRLAVADALLLDRQQGPFDSPFRLGRFHCMAMVVLIGNQVAEAAAAQFADVAAQPIAPRSPLIESASRVTGGIVWRIAGETTESVAQRIAGGLEFLGKTLGDSVWARKW